MAQANENQPSTCSVGSRKLLYNDFTANQTHNAKRFSSISGAQTARARYLWLLKRGTTNPTSLYPTFATTSVPRHLNSRIANSRFQWKWNIVLFLCSSLVLVIDVWAQWNGSSTVLQLTRRQCSTHCDRSHVAHDAKHSSERGTRACDSSTEDPDVWHGRVWFEHKMCCDLSSLCELSTQTCRVRKRYPSEQLQFIKSKRNIQLKTQM